MYGNVSHATIRSSADERMYPAVSENGAFLFIGDAQISFGHGQAAIDAIAHLTIALADLRNRVVDRERILGLTEQVNAMTRAIEAEKLTPDPGDHYVRTPA